MVQSISRSFAMKVTAFVLIHVVGLGSPLQALAAATARSADRARPPAEPAPTRPGPRTEPRTIAGSEPFADLGSSAASGPELWMRGAGGEASSSLLPVPLTPVAAELRDSAAAEAWAAFDGDSKTVWRSEDGAVTRLELTLARPAEVHDLTLLGASAGVVSVLAERDGAFRPIAGLENVAVRLEAGRWARLSAGEAVRTARLRVEWQPSDESGPAEIGLWGMQAPERVYAQDQLADQIVAGTVPGALSTWAAPAVGAIAGGQEATFELTLEQLPQATARAFLVYELSGIAHWTGVARSVNGGRVLGGAAPRWGQGGGLQVEEISPRWLRAGRNVVRFGATEGPRAAIRNVRLVTLAQSGFVATLPSAASAGEDREASELARAFEFGAPSQPHYLTFQLQAKSEGQLRLSAPGKRSATDLSIDLKGLAPGWHRYPLDGLLPAASQLGVKYQAPAQKKSSRRAVPVSDLAVAASRVVSAAQPRLAVSFPLHGECVEGRAYVRGFVDAAAALRELSANGRTAPEFVGDDNGFMALVSPPAGGKQPWSVALRARLQDGQVLETHVPMQPCVEASGAGTVVDEGAPYGEWVYPDRATTLTYAGATLTVPAGAVEQPTRITIRPLVAEQVMQLNRGLVNVTPGARAFRFGPHGLKFKKPVALSLPFDGARVPPGYRTQNITAYYFDEQLNHWVSVGRMDAPEDGRLTSATEHFTDFINATVAMPDSPGLKSYNPTELKGMKLGSPSAGVTLIEPPSPNPQGSAALDYPIEVPPGRRGVQPSLSLSYNTQAENGWLGVGWDLGLSRISIDTRFGVPRYDGTESFVLDGQPLVHVAGSANQYRRRVEGAFDHIERVLDNGAPHWVVTGKDGTAYIYGQGADARLADPEEPSHVFEWHLEKIVDTFGNELSVDYFHDQSTLGSGGEPFDQLYPERIEYTANPGASLGASYAVEFHLDRTRPEAERRPDVKLDGRAGFLVATRYRLEQIDVLYGAEPIRSYTFAYREGDFRKSLLDSVAFHGRTGQELYRHTFEYFEQAARTGEDNGTPLYDLFEEGAAWGDVLNGQTSPRTEHGLARNEGNMKGISGEAGVGIGPVNLTFGGGGNDGDNTTHFRFLDLNGDGLSDGLDNRGRGSLNLLARPNQDKFLFDLLGRAGSGGGLRRDKDLGFSDQDGWSITGGINVGLISATASYTRTNTEDENLITDFNGDGLPDLLRVVDGTVRVRLNDGQNRFADETTLAGNPLDLSDLVQTRSDRVQQAKSHAFLVDPLMRWVAPFDGTVDITGPVRREVAGGDGVRVQIFHNDGALPSWEHTIAAADTAECAPGPGNGCGGGLNLPVSAGDRLYFKVSSIDDTIRDDVRWNPTITYRKSSSELSLLEPYGRPMYRFSQAGDFRVAGRPAARWVASAKGVVHISGDAIPPLGTLADDVRVRVVRTRNDGTEEVLVSGVLDGSGATSPNSVPVNLSVPVEAAEDIRFVLESDVQIDPLTVGWQPRVEYQEYCRSTPTDPPSEVCGAVSCWLDLDGREFCTIAGDPVPDVPIPGDVIKQNPFVASSTFEWLPRLETQTFMASGGTLNVSGTVGKPSGAPATVLVQGVNRLLYKEVLDPSAISVPVSFSASASAGEQLFFTVLTNSASAGSISWSPRVNGISAPVNVRYPDPAFGINPLTRWPVDGMGGGFHHWYYGDWNGAVAFDESHIRWNDPTNSSSTFMFAAPVWIPPAPAAPPGTEPIPAWVGRGAGSYIAPGAINPSRLVNIVPGMDRHGRIKALRLADTWNFVLAGNVAIAGISYSMGDTVTDLDLLDMNGDRLPDSVYPDGVRYNDAGQGFSPKQPLPLGEIRRVEHRNGAGSVGYQKELLNKTNSKGKTEALLQTGFTAGVDYGQSATHVDLVDINGDGLPDRLHQGGEASLEVRLNLGYGFSRPIRWTSAGWATTRVEPTGSGLADEIRSFVNNITTAAIDPGAVRTDVLRLDDTANENLGIGIDVDMVSGGGGLTRGTSRTYVDLVDLTGDGLPEHVYRAAGSNTLHVKLNLGDRFASPVAWTIPSWGNDIDPDDGDFLSSGAVDALSFSRSNSYSGSFGFKICVVLCVGVSGFWNENRSNSHMSFDDIDGDGNVDHVLKLDGDARVYVKKNRLAKTNLLRRVVRPLGGEFELDYQRQGNLAARTNGTRGGIDMPQNQWVLTSVVSRDGAGHSYPQTHQYYQDGYYDRVERDSYGYARVTTTREDGSRIDTRFHNQDYYRKGLPSQTTESDASGQLYTAELVTYRVPGALPDLTGTFFPGESERETRFYEGTTTDLAAPGKSTRETRRYDVDLGEEELGRLREYTDFADDGSDDDLLYEIDYVTRPGHILRANRVVATNAAGQVLRERESSFDARGAMESLTNYITGGRNAAGTPYTRTASTYTFTYDAGGNLQTVTDPNAYVLTYTYDPTTLTYLTNATDSFGYSSSSVPNYHFGAVNSTTDTNGQQVQFAYDAYGRITHVWGPKDTGSTPTIGFEYSLPDHPPSGTGFQPAWARTLHKDITSELEDPLVTVTFVDGLDRVIQTKKDLERDTGTGTEIGMTVSGRITFDARGRVAAQTQPWFELSTAPSHAAVTNALSYDAATAGQHATTFTHDVLGRTTSVLLPDATQTTSTYGFATLDGQTYFSTTVTDANNKQRITYRDVDDSIAAVQEHNTIGGTLRTLLTRYAYNPLNELLSVTDARGNVTSSQYDTVGRMVRLTSPDQGETEWRYDLVGNLRVKETARLRAANQLIRYEYDFNRLRRIDYPGAEVDVTYEYGTPAEAGNAAGNLAGRLKREISEPGTREFSYDELGNIVRRYTSYHRMREPHLGPYEQTVRYSFDSFGRMLQARFPGSGAEVISYGYDRGGLVRSAFGLNTQVNPQHPDESPNTLYFIHIGYDEFEQRTRTVHGNGIETHLVYEPTTRRLSQINANYQDRAINQPSRPFQQLRYDYDNVGNIEEARNDAPYSDTLNASVLVGPVTHNYTYDDLYQLTNASGLYQNRTHWRWAYTFTQTYDEIGNLTSKDQNSWREKLENGQYIFDHTERPQTYRNSYVYGGPRPHAPTHIDEYVPAESQPRPIDLTYDASGNQTVRLYRNSERRTITWDADDRIKVVNTQGQDISVARYDGEGQRAVHLHRVVGLEETAYVDQHLTIRDGRYATKHVYAGSTRMASKMDPDWFQYPPTLYYHPDHLGSTNYVTNDDQTLTQHDEYFPSGEPWWDETDSRYESRRAYVFNGKELDISTGLYYYGARYYDARQGNWLSPDPILQQYMDGVGNGGVYTPRNLGLYTYTWNNPVNAVDPDGKIVWFVAIAVVAGITLTPQYANAPAPGQPTISKGPLELGREMVQNSVAAAQVMRNPTAVLRSAAEQTATEAVVQVANQVDPSGNLGKAVEVAADARAMARSGPKAGPKASAVGSGRSGGGDKVGSLPKPPTGKGSVPKADRDPKRTWTPAERATKRDAQGGKCATGCGKDIDASNSHGHHVKRHADGGRTNDANHAEVCVDCHSKLHSP